MRKTSLVGPLVALWFAGACGDNPVSGSAPISINLKAASGDVKGNSAITEEKGITTESGNPWGKFVADSRARLGRDPGDIKLSQFTLLLGGNSKNVVALEEVMTGDVVVQFVMDTSNNTLNVGRVANPTGRGPVTLQVEFNFAQVAPQDLTKFLGGSFKVVLAGTAAASFMGKGAEADLQLTFQFESFAQPQT